MRKFPRLLVALLTVPVLAGLIAFRSPTQQPGAPLSQGVERSYQAPWGPAREGVAEPEWGRVEPILRADAAYLISRQFKRLAKRPIEPAELELIQVTAWLETQYGMGWGVSESPRQGAGAGSNNWGAITAPCGPRAFASGDHNREGAAIRACFAIYDTPEQGARALVRWFVTRPEILTALGDGDVHGIRAALALMHDAHFYAGVGRTREARIERRLADYMDAREYVNGDDWCGSHGCGRGNNATGGNYGDQ